MKFKQTINVKKFISILLCTVLISAMLPSNLLNCTVFAANNYHYEGSDVKITIEISTNTLAKVVNETDQNNHVELEKNKDYTFSYDDNNGKTERMCIITLKKEYLEKLSIGKYSIQTYCYPYGNEDCDAIPCAITTIDIDEATNPDPPTLIEPGYCNDKTKNKTIYSNKNTGITFSGKGIVGCNVTINDVTNSTKPVLLGQEPTNDKNGKWEITLTSELKEGTYPLSIFHTNTKTSKSSEPINPKLIVDTTPPNIAIKIDGEEKLCYTEFSNDEKETIPTHEFPINFTISATDTLSGIDQTEYLITEKTFTNTDEANKADGWTIYPGKLYQGLAGSRVRIYAKATDRAGNYKIVNTPYFLLYTKPENK